MERLECKQIKALAERYNLLSEKREIIESGCNLLEWNAEFLDKYIETYVEDIHIEYDPKVRERFSRIQGILSYSGGLWRKTIEELSQVEKELKRALGFEAL